jgi:signal transduction histidine kinase
MLSEIDIVKYGGIHDDVVLLPLPSRFLPIHETLDDKINLYVNHINTSLNDKKLKINYHDEAFINLDSKKFDVNGLLDYLISLLLEESKLQSDFRIFLSIGLAILNVIAHVLMISLILSLLRKESQKLLKLEKFSAIGELSARLAHDLLNPLSVLSGIIELVKFSKNNTLTDKQITRAETSVSRMSHQIKDVMDFVRTSKLNIEKVSIMEIMDNSISRVLVPDTVLIEKPENDFEINCDKNKLEVVFANLFSNAIDAIDSKGKIKIHLQNTVNYTEIKFEDSGPGIKDKSIDQIFEALVTTKQKGTGLGLASCKNIIALHGGTISAKNNPTTFTIVLPHDISSHYVDSF